MRKSCFSAGGWKILFQSSASRVRIKNRCHVDKNIPGGREVDTALLSLGGRFRLKFTLPLLTYGCLPTDIY